MAGLCAICGALSWYSTTETLFIDCPSCGATLCQKCYEKHVVPESFSRLFTCAVCRAQEMSDEFLLHELLRTFGMSRETAMKLIAGRLLTEHAEGQKK